MDIVDGNIIRSTDGKVLMSLKELAMTAQYNAAKSERITAESTFTIRNNAYSFGCTFVDIEVDIPMCKVTLRDIVNVHDCGKLINPALAEAQVHGGMSMAIGTKALGEPPACSGAPAIRNAILNATGVAIDQNPMNAHILFKRFSEEGLIQD